MSRDIRSFFTVVSKKSGTDSSTSNSSKKKSKRLIDSDDEDVISATPEQKTQKPQKKPHKPEKKQKVVVLSSDSENEVSKIVTKPEPKLKPVNVTDVFKNTPIKQSKVEPLKPQPEEKIVEKEAKKSRSKKKSNKDKEKKVHNDEKFEMTLEDLDDDIFEQSIVENLDKLEETEALLQDNDDKKENVNNRENQETTTSRKRSRTDSNDGITPKKKKIEHTDSGIDPGQEAHEKKRYSAMLYQKYLNRSGPKLHGMKELPKGKPNCLKDLCFLKTGVLESLESEEFENLIKQHGGRVVHGVSKKVNYVVVGEEPGPSKLAKADTYNIPNITEDELFDLILTKSGLEPKYCKKNMSCDSADLGFETDSEVRPSENTEKEDNKKEADTNKKVNESKETPATDSDLKASKKTKKVEDSNKDPEMNEKVNKPKETSKENKKKESQGSSQDKPKPNKKEQNGHISSSSFYAKPSTSKISHEEIDENTDSSHKETDMSLPLTEKYKPQSLRAVIGQQGDSSNLNKLKNWLVNWHKNQDPKTKKTLIRPSPWAKNDNGAYFKCALLSGSPGVGKTTTATLVAKELGLDIVEFNASDTRSKRLLHEEVSQLLSTNTIAGFATGQSKVNSKRVLLMDEVDGMAGNEDRGGIQELIQLIKNSNVPIICMCNDRNHQKMRSLVNYCFDLKFSKPRLEQIRGAMMSICFKEKIDISVQALSEIISGTGCDVRQTLNHLALLGSTDQKITTEIAEKEAKSSKKDIVMGPWEVCRTVFTHSEHKDKSIADKARLFFFDYSLGPLFVQENYLKVQPEGVPKKQHLLRAAMSADSISMGDIIDSKIRRSNNWSLLESQAFYSSVLPGHYMSGNFTGQINFPGWLGKNSKKNKFKRILGEIQSHTRTSAYASRMAIKLDYIVSLRNAIILPLKKKGMEGIEDAVAVMKAYNLLREDVDSLVELCQWTKGDNPMSGVETKVKTAFTRAYNKQVTMLPYAPISGIAKKKAAALESDLLGEEETIVSDNEEDNDISNNAMIKIKKKPAAKGKKTDEGPSSSKKTEAKKGKGKKSK